MDKNNLIHLKKRQFSSEKRNIENFKRTKKVYFM